MANPATTTPAGYAFGPFVLDLREEDLYSAGVPQAVDNQIFKLLVAFAVKSQCTLSRNELADDAKLAPTYIEHLVHKTREVIGDVEHKIIIQTRRSNGYRLALKATPIPDGGIEKALKDSQSVEARVEVVDLYRLRHGHRDKPKIRVSMAALLSIHQDDNYVLVSAYRRKQLKPFGGVYTYFEKARSTFAQLAFRPEERSPSVNDLRGFIDRSNLAHFVRWFNLCKDREGPECLRRELTEELSENGMERIAKSVHNPQFTLKWTIEEGPEDVPNKDYLQFRAFDVYDFSPSDPEGMRITKALFKAAKNNDKIGIVTREEIIAGRTRSQMNLGTHSAYLIGKKKLWHDPPPPFGL